MKVVSHLTIEPPIRLVLDNGTAIEIGEGGLTFSHMPNSSFTFSISVDEMADMMMAYWKYRTEAKLTSSSMTKIKTKKGKSPKLSV